METLRLSPFSINLELNNIQSFPSCVTRKVEKSTTNRSARHPLLRKVYNLSSIFEIKNKFSSSIKLYKKSILFHNFCK